MYLINTILGFLIAQIADIINGVRNSENTPVKFNLIFYLKDTWLKAVLSFVLSLLLSTLLYLNFEDALKIFSDELTTLNNLVYAVFGAIPEVILQLIRKRTGFTTPEEVDGYKRK